MIYHLTSRWTLIAALAAVSYSMGTMPAAAAEPEAGPPELFCQIRYASETRTLHQSATTDPYSAATADFDNRFRFKAVVLGSPGRIDHITLTVYELFKEAPPVIIHQVRYHAPFNMNNEIPALTGWNHVYANYLGRELRYGCALQSVQS
ncbi:MAG: hypothetical protein E6Q60_01310 [Nitrosomonas oligotropha]|uniref:Uncharacterized protein n=1 Tax=Nitrosomonas oligotropha TaxID=42354 RepID=A0A5C7W2E9_9PROT|nr:MAG: hypothetical protein E6Q60_01310 [Nitrosomonas oligotropha]